MIAMKGWCMNMWIRKIALIGAVLASATSAYAVPSDFEVRCFTESKDDTGLVQSFSAETCEEIGDTVPYLSLGRMVSAESIYSASADLHCQDKSKGACIACLNGWRANYKALLSNMVAGKLISKQNKTWMLQALSGFYAELKSGCQ